MSRDLDIRQLLSRVSEGDEDAFKVLFNAYGHKINSFATRLTGSAIVGQETVQDVFMKVWVRRQSLTTIENFDAYLYRIVRNYVYNVLRRKALEVQAKTMLRNEFTAVTEFAEDDTLQERKQLLHRIIDGLPQQQRKVFNLCQLQGLKYQEAANLLNISQLTVKTHMQQALRTIRIQLSRFIVSVICFFSVI